MLLASHGTDDTRGGRGSESCWSNLLYTTFGIIFNLSSCFAIGVAICLTLDLALRRRFIGLPRFRLVVRGIKTLEAVIFVSSVEGDDRCERNGSTTAPLASGASSSPRRCCRRRRRRHRSSERCRRSMLRTVLFHSVFPSCGRR